MTHQRKRTAATERSGDKPSPLATSPTVAAYFERRIGVPLEAAPQPDQPYSPYHPNFTIDTGCGVECKKAIDAAAELIKHGASAGWEVLPTPRRTVAKLIREIVRVYVYG